MKTYSSKLIIMVIIITGFSCNDDILYLFPESELSVEGFYKDSVDIDYAVNGVYASLQTNGQYRESFVYLMEVRSDNSTVEDAARAGARYGDLEFFNESTANPVVESAWRECYRGIQRANVVLNRIDDLNFSNSATKNSRIGEVKFIRALTYFNIVQIWGEAPLILSEVQDPFEAFGEGRDPINKIYEQIIDDLKRAIELLPTNQREKGRVEKNAAKALLAKVYLTLKDYSNALTYAEQVIMANQYSLLDDFSDIFLTTNENNEEIIFGVQFKAGEEGEGSKFTNLFAPRGATEVVNGVGSTIGDNIPTLDLFNAYSHQDLRRDKTIGVLDDGRYYTKKYLSTPFADGSSDNDFIIIRYADLLLIAAESANKLGYQPEGQSFNYLNQVRVRAGLPELSETDLPDQDAFHNQIVLERRLELAFENHRWFDLVRNDIAVEVMSQIRVFGSFLPIGDHQVLYAVPQREIETNPTLTQNTGYY